MYPGSQFIRDRYRNPMVKHDTMLLLICLTKAVPCLDFPSPTCYFNWLTTICPTGCCEKQVLHYCDPVASSFFFSLTSLLGV